MFTNDKIDHKPDTRATHRYNYDLFDIRSLTRNIELFPQRDKRCEIAPDD